MWLKLSAVWRAFLNLSGKLLCSYEVVGFKVIERSERKKVTTSVSKVLEMLINVLGKK